MSKTKVRFTLLARIAKGFHEPRAVRSAADAMREAVLKLISRGISPVFGEGRFIGYKNPKKYPGNLKPRRPVNLKFTGRLHDTIDYKVLGKKIKFGMISKRKKDIDKAEGLLDGANGMAGPRKFVAGEGDKYKPQIMIAIRGAIRDYVKKYFK
jgi:hypothetical protein